MMGVVLTTLICLSSKTIGATNYFSECCTVTVYNAETDKYYSARACATTFSAACDAAFKQARKAAIAARN